MPEISSEQVFIREMIPHHQEAIDSAQIVLETTQNEDLKTILENIIVEQEREIAMMQNWLAEWYPTDNASTSYAPMMGDLESLSGEERDVAFLQGMIMHHQMAIDMATDVLALQPREEVKTLAQNIITSQSAEIGTMKLMLAEQYGESEQGHGHG